MVLQTGQAILTSWCAPGYYSIGANSSLGGQYFATTGEASLSPVRLGQYRGGLIGSIRGFFWGPTPRPQPAPPGEKRTNYHVPLADELASSSARRCRSPSRRR